MKIKIDKDGQLWIERAGKFKLQGCHDDTDGAKCGDWCPLFGGPDMNPVGGTREDYLYICQDKTLHGEIIDERKREDVT